MSRLCGSHMGGDVFESVYLGSLLSPVPAFLCPSGKHCSSMSSEPQGGGWEPGFTCGLTAGQGWRTHGECGRARVATQRHGVEDVDCGEWLCAGIQGPRG